MTGNLKKILMPATSRRGRYAPTLVVLQYTMSTVDDANARRASARMQFQDVVKANLGQPLHPCGLKNGNAMAHVHGWLVFAQRAWCRAGCAVASRKFRLDQVRRVWVMLEQGKQATAEEAW